MPAPIVDWAGRPIDQRHVAPGGGQFVYPNRGSWWDTIARDITPASIISYIDQADRGQPSNLMQLFDRMVDRDDRLQTVIETRRLALTGVDRMISPRYSEDPRADKSAELVREVIKGVDFDDLLDGLLDGVPKGLACYEIVWEGSTPIAVVEVPQSMLRWEDGTLLVDIAEGKGRANYQPIEANKYVVFSPRTKPGNKSRRGILRALSILWVAKHWSLKDWAAFVEVFGMPLRLGVYPDGMTEDQKSELYQALQDLGSDSSAMIPENMRIEFPKALGSVGAGDRGTPMKELIDYVDTSYAIRFLGQNLTTESQSGSGTLAGNAHENVRKDYLRADAKALAAVVEEDFFRPIVGFNLGWDYPVPKLWFDVDDAQDDASRMSVYVEGSKIPGMEYSKAQIREEFNFNEPIDEEDAIRIAAPSEANTEAIDSFRAANPQRFSVADDVTDKNKDGLSSGIRASSGVARDTIALAQDELISICFGFVDRLVGEVDTPEQLLRRIRLAAPDLIPAMEASGFRVDDVEDIISRAYHSSTYNGEASVENELEYQKKEEGIE